MKKLLIIIFVCSAFVSSSAWANDLDNDGWIGTTSEQEAVRIDMPRAVVDAIKSNTIVRIDVSADCVWSCCRLHLADYAEDEAEPTRYSFAMGQHAGMWHTAPDRQIIIGSNRDHSFDIEVRKCNTGEIDNPDDYEWAIQVGISADNLRDASIDSQDRVMLRSKGSDNLPPFIYLEATRKKKGSIKTFYERLKGMMGSEKKVEPVRTIEERDPLPDTDDLIVRPDDDDD